MSDSHGPGPFTKLMTGVAVLVVMGVAIHEVLIAYDYIPTPVSRLEERARRAAIQKGGVVYQTPRAPSVPTTAHSTLIGPPAPAQPLPNHVKSSACNDPRAERRINPETGNRSCFVPD